MEEGAGTSVICWQDEGGVRSSSLTGPLLFSRKGGKPLSFQRMY